MKKIIILVLLILISFDLSFADAMPVLDGMDKELSTGAKQIIVLSFCAIALTLFLIIKKIKS